MSSTDWFVSPCLSLRSLAILLLTSNQQLINVASEGVCCLCSHVPCYVQKHPGNLCHMELYHRDFHAHYLLILQSKYTAISRKASFCLTLNSVTGSGHVKYERRYSSWCHVVSVVTKHAKWPYKNQKGTEHVFHVVTSWQEIPVTLL